MCTGLQNEQIVDRKMGLCLNLNTGDPDLCSLLINCLGVFYIETAFITCCMGEQPIWKEHKYIQSKSKLTWFHDMTKLRHHVENIVFSFLDIYTWIKFKSIEGIILYKLHWLFISKIFGLANGSLEKIYRRIFFVILISNLYFPLLKLYFENLKLIIFKSQSVRELNQFV